MTAPTIKKQILEYVTANDWVSFAELQRIEGFKEPEDATSHTRLSLPGFENIILWEGLTQEAADALKELQQEQKVYLQPGSWFSYLHDGASLRLPLAKQARNYAEPHWLPRFCRPGTPPKMKAKPSQAKKAA
jgi:hypothetical protein